MTSGRLAAALMLTPPGGVTGGASAIGEDGAAVAPYRGRPLHLNRTRSADITDHASMKGAWSFLVAGSGHQGIGGGLNSIDFDRQQARLQIGVEF